MKRVQLCGSLNILWHCLSLRLEWNLTFSSPVATAVFSKLAGICSSLTGSSLRIWNSSVEIPSPLLALFVVMLPKAHVTSLSRMSSSKWVITPSWLSGSWRSFIAQLLNNLSAMQETWVWSLGWEDLLEKGETTPCSILAWSIPWTVIGIHTTCLP